MTNLSRRRLKTFFAKWGGLVLAAVMVLPIAIIGGLYLNANTRIDNTTNWVTQAIAITGFEVGDPVPDIEDIVYYLYLYIDNGTPDDAQISITNPRLTINGLIFDILNTDTWHGTIAKKDILVLGGAVIISADEAQKLEDKIITLRLTGTVTAKARYAFVSKEETRSINVIYEAVIPAHPPPSPVAMEPLTSPPPSLTECYTGHYITA